MMAASVAAAAGGSEGDGSELQCLDAICLSNRLPHHYHFSSTPFPSNDPFKDEQQQQQRSFSNLHEFTISLSLFLLPASTEQGATQT